MKRLAVLLFIATLALIGFRFHLRSAKTELPDIKTIHEQTGVPVRVERPQRLDLVETVEITGQLEELVSVPGTFEVDGRLVSLTAKVGDQVEKGQVLARLDSRDQHAHVAIAEAGLAAARATLQKAERGPRGQELAAGRARRDEAAAGLKFARDELARVRKLASKKAASRQQLDQAQSNFDMAVARLEQAKEGLALLEEGVREEDRATARAQVQLAEGQLTLATLTLEKHELRAPIAGVITERHVEPGDMVVNMPSPQKVVGLVTMNPILFVTELSELYVPHLSKGCEVDVLVDALQDEVFPARVHEVSPVADASSRSFRVEFSIDNPSLRLKPGMFARARLRLRQSLSALTVPDFTLRAPASVEAVEGAPEHCLPHDEKAVFAGRGRRAIVMTARQSRATARPVRVGIVEGGRAEILAGLDEESQVIVDGFEEIKAGRKLSSSAAGKGGRP